MEYQNLLESALELEEIDINYYRSRHLWIPIGARGVFGGQVVGQALVAAIATVPREKSVHSLHSYFILPGDNKIPIQYEVQRIRDGKSYCTRTVLAKQKGRCIFTLTCSFAIPESTGVEHQQPMPECRGPDSFISQQELMKGLVKHPDVPKWYSKYIEKVLELEDSPFEIRHISLMSVEDVLYPKKSTKQLMWIKAKESLRDDLSLHKTVLAYATDYHILLTAAKPHGLSPISKPRLGMMASLCSSIWYHDSKFRADEWQVYRRLLYEMETTRASSGRGLAFGRIYTQDGRLIASVSQEGILRVDSKDEKKSKL
ncbi:hypothetical protein G9A89_019549 [Geosiphon pyriformis]|nr:hypothetical protein G9A89_019549 [Geosiphon pyriformis]